MTSHTWNPPPTFQSALVEGYINLTSVYECTRCNCLITYFAITTGNFPEYISKNCDEELIKRIYKL